MNRLRSLKIAAAVLGMALAAQPGIPFQDGKQSKDAPLLGVADLFDLGKLPFAKGHKAYMASSHDREGGNYDWANYLRVEGDEGVILDVAGPGMIVRVWSANAKGMLRIYLDGEPAPAVEEDFQAFLERMPLHMGIGQPEGGREARINLTLQKNQPLGRTTYCVIPFNRGCRVTLTPAPAVYYQFNYLLFDSPHGLPTFSPEHPGRQQDVYQDIQRRFGDAETTDNPEHVHKGSVSLKPGDGKTVLDAPGPFTIEKMVFEVEYPEDTAHLRHVKDSLLLRAFWDGDNRGEYSRPSIKAPLAAFFMDFGVLEQYRTACMTKDGARYECLFPMPVRERARIELINASVLEIKNIHYEIHSAPMEAWDSRLYHFKALYHSEDGSFGQDEADYQTRVMHLRNTGGDENYALLRAWGRGHYVGGCFFVDMAETPFVRSIVESDEAVFVDDDPARTMWGTGTEDYLNDAWGLHTFSQPLSGAGGFYESGMRQVFGYRFHLSDAIAFDKKILFSLEHGSSNNCTARYRSVAYYYMAEEPHSEVLEGVAPRDMKKYWKR